MARRDDGPYSPGPATRPAQPKASAAGNASGGPRKQLGFGAARRHAQQQWTPLLQRIGRLAIGRKSQQVWESRRRRRIRCRIVSGDSNTRSEGADGPGHDADVSRAKSPGDGRVIGGAPGQVLVRQPVAANRSAGSRSTRERPATSATRSCTGGSPTDAPVRPGPELGR